MEENEWIEKELPNGDIFHLAERIKANEPLVKKSNEKSKITITNYPKFTNSIIIFLTHNKELVGFIECKLLENNKAELNVAGFMRDILEKQFGQICIGTPAIRIEEKFRRLGKGTILLIILFEYLINKGINNVNVHTIESDSAWRFYLNNGAIKINNMDAIFYDIESILPHLYEKVGNQLDRNIFKNSIIRK